MKQVRIVCARMLPPEMKLQAEKRGVTVFDHDFLEINYLDNETIRSIIENSESEFVFTSVHAVKAVSGIAKRHQLVFKNKISYCITGPTSSLAAENGFEVKDEAENALKLTNRILEHSPAKLTLFAGNIRRHEMEEILAKEKTELQAQVVYEKKPVAKKVGSFEGVMFFSPSQVDAFLMANELLPSIPAFCIGTTTANYLKEKEHKNILTAAKSDSASVLEEVYKYFKL